MLRKVTKSAEGAIINIGDWDFGIRTEEREQTVTRTEMRVVPGILDALGNPLQVETSVTETVIVPVEVVTNPLPDGSYEDTADIVTGFDGGLYASDDPRRLG